MWTYNYSYEYTNEDLMHYGVVGMKWGVRRAIRKQSANERLRNKAYKLDAKSAKAYKTSERIHAIEDLDRSNKAAKKAANLGKKAANLHRKALKTDDVTKSLALEKKAARLDYKSSKNLREANRLSKTSGYSVDAMKYAAKSDKLALKAAKARMKIASNEAYVNAMKKKASSISAEERQNGYAFVNQLLDKK